MSEKRGYGPASVIGVLDGVSSSAITVRQSRCAMVRNRNVHCMKCADACTSGCIHLVEGVLHVDASKCVGCGTCATVCPTCALEAHNPSDGQLMRQATAVQRDDMVVLMCHPCLEALSDAVDAESIAEVVCLGRVDESLLVGLAQRGAKTIRLICGDCAKCQQNRGRSCAQMVAESASELLQLWQLQVDIRVDGTVPAGVLRDGCDEDHARVKLQQHFAKGAGNSPINPERHAEDGSHVDSAAQTVSDDEHEQRRQVLKVMRDGTLPHFVPERRERLLEAMASFGKPLCDSMSNRLWGCVAIDPGKCVSCRMCATFCPTGAIRKFDNPDGSFGVQHYPGDCVKCGSCREICPGGAITINDAVRVSYLFDGAVHSYAMRPREIELNSPHQILNTMKRKIPGNVYER